MNRVREYFACRHDWWVVSTAVCDGCLMLQCRRCGATNAVDEPTRGEWAEAFRAPTRPYRWHDETRLRHR